jgi:hypothetical protein
MVTTGRFGEEKCPRTPEKTMEISPAEDLAVLKAVAEVSGSQGHWADVMVAIRSSIAPEKVGLWRQSAKSRGLIVQHDNLMNVARITDKGNRMVQERA